MGFKVIIIYGQPYGFQDQPFGSRSTMDYTYAILLATTKLEKEKSVPRAVIFCFGSGIQRLKTG
jgi:hypothetical protein